VRVVVASTYIPFCKGGGNKIAEDLNSELQRRGFESDLVMLPFYSYWVDYPAQTAALRLLDLSESCGNRNDRLITNRTPAYALPHPNKVVWFIHHHRAAYDLWGHPLSGMPQNPVSRYYRDLYRRTDDIYLKECRAIYTNSQVVADRLLKFNDLRADAVLYPPLHGDHDFRPGPFGDYIFYPSRLTAIKRQSLAVEALKHTRTPVRLVIGGAPDSSRFLAELKHQVRATGVGGRVELTGWLSEPRKAELMAGCCGALYLAYDEDSYGYVTLEAFHAHKPVVTLTDSGGPLEVIRDGQNGLIVEPTPEALAAAMDRLYEDRRLGERLGREGGRSLDRHRIDWDHVIEKLTS